MYTLYTCRMQKVRQIRPVIALLTARIDAVTRRVAPEVLALRQQL